MTYHCFLLFIIKSNKHVVVGGRQNVVGPSVKNLGAQLSVSSVYRGKLTSDVIIQTGVNQCEI